MVGSGKLPHVMSHKSSSVGAEEYYHYKVILPDLGNLLLHISASGTHLEVTSATKPNPCLNCQGFGLVGFFSQEISME